MKSRSLTLYKPDRHNYGVVTYQFIFTQTVQDGNADCDIYQANDPYRDQKKITTSLQKYQFEGFHRSAQIAYEECLRFQREAVERLRDRLKVSQDHLSSLEKGFLEYTPEN